MNLWARVHKGKYHPAKPGGHGTEDKFLVRHVTSLN